MKLDERNKRHSAPQPKRLAAALSLVVFAFVYVTCDAGAGRYDDAKRYASPIAEAAQHGLRTYWLGAQFDAGGKTFVAGDAKFPEGIEGEPVGGIELQYAHPGPFIGGLSIVTVPTEAWSRSRNQVVASLLRLGAQPYSVSNRGSTAELFLVPLDDENVHEFVLVTDVRDAIVVARTSSVRDPSGTQLNPLMEQDTFMAGVAGLRPYPE